MKTTAPIKNFNRLEYKYLLTLDEKAKMLEALSSYIVPDANGVNGNYKIESLYYDTEDLKFYNEKATGIRFRKMLRIRRYVGRHFDENSQVYVEIKEKHDRVTLKRRVEMSYREATDFLEKGIIPTHAPEDHEVVMEIYDIVRAEPLKPTAITSYNRAAFFGTDTSTGLRMTFDTTVAFQKSNPALGNVKKDGDIVSNDLTILEVKANNALPAYVQDFLDANNISPIRMSKYASAITK